MRRRQGRRRAISGLWWSRSRPLGSVILGPRPLGRGREGKESRFPPFLVVVRGGQGSHGGARVAHRHMVPRLGQKESPAEMGLPAAMSAFLRIRSALPPGTDLPDGVADGPKVPSRPGEFHPEPTRHEQTFGDTTRNVCSWG